MSRSPRIGNSAPPTTGQGEEAIAGQSGIYYDRVNIAAAIAGDPSITHPQAGRLHTQQVALLHTLDILYTGKGTYIFINY